jgi:hypothetical protein
MEIRIMFPNFSIDKIIFSLERCIHNNKNINNLIVQTSDEV